MKTRYILLAGALSVASLVSCEDYLDKNIVTTENEEFTFASYSNAVTVAYAAYADLTAGFAEIYGSGGSAMLASATDECEFAVQTQNVQKFNLGSWSPSSMPDNPFSKYYTGIRKVYNFLDDADMIDYSDVKDNPSQPGIYEERLADVAMLKSEVQLLRAIFLFELIKRFGGVPLVDQRYATDVDKSTIQRASLEDCVNEIIRVCDQCAAELPVKQIDTETGRLTSGVAKAIKSEVLLFAASELWNNPSWAGGYSNPELISLPAGDRLARWKAAADAALDVIAMEAEAGYALDTYSNLFGPNGHKSPEVIFCRRQGASNSFETVNYPISYDKVTGGNCPTQDMVDMFQMADGSDFNWSDPAMKADPYANRDPRLAAFVITNNTYFKDRNVECWTGGRDGAGVRNCTPTGYYLKKYVYQWNDLLQNQTSVHTWIFIRLAEIYLNYAEALNEYAPGNPDIKVYYDKVRTRAGMPGLPAGLSQAQVREAIRRERAVEFCFEGKRFFDLRRWMRGDVLGAPVHAVEITKNADNSFTYAPYELETRAFSEKMYFYPIPRAEILKMPHWVQNPLW